MTPAKNPFFIAFGYFCYLAGLAFFLAGGWLTFNLGYQMFFGANGEGGLFGGGLFVILMFPIGPILMAMGYAVFKLGRNIHNPPPKDKDDEEEDEDEKIQ